MKSSTSGKIGTALSLGCAVHCLSFPLIVPFIPAVGKGLLFSHTTEILIISLAIIFGIITLWHGYYKHHRNIAVFPLFSAGVMIILTGFFMHAPHNEVQFTPSFSTILLVIGGVLMGAAQIINFSLQQKSKYLAGK